MVKQQGMTLLELMIVVVIIGVLTLVAMPAYQSYVAKGNRSEAQRELHKVANLQEQYFADHKSYTTDMTKLGFSSDPYITPESNYSIDVSAVADIKSDFIATATAIGKQANNDSDCSVMTLNYLAVKTAKSGSTTTTSKCW